MANNNRLQQFASENQELIIHGARRRTHQSENIVGGINTGIVTNNDIASDPSDISQSMPIVSESQHDQMILNRHIPDPGCEADTSVQSQSSNSTLSPCHGFSSPGTTHIQRDVNWMETPIGQGHMGAFAGGSTSQPLQFRPSVELSRDFESLRGWLSPILTPQDKSSIPIDQKEFERLTAWIKNLQDRCLQERLPTMLNELETMKRLLNDRSPLIVQNNSHSSSNIMIGSNEDNSVPSGNPRSTSTIDQSLEESHGLFNALNGLNKTLSPDQREELINKIPELVSRLDGLPSPAIIQQQIDTINNFNERFTDKLAVACLVERMNTVESRISVLSELSDRLVGTNNEIVAFNRNFLSSLNASVERLDSGVTGMSHRVNTVDSLIKSSNDWIIDINRRMTIVEGNLRSVPIYDQGQHNEHIQVCAPSTFVVPSVTSSCQPVIANHPVYTTAQIQVPTPTTYISSPFGDHQLPPNLVEPILPMSAALHAQQTGNSHQRAPQVNPQPLSEPPGRQFLPTSSIPGQMSRSGSSASLNSSASDSAVGKIQERGIKRIISGINTILTQPLEKSLSDAEIIDLHTNVLKDMSQLVKDSDSCAVQYARVLDHDSGLLDSLGDITAKGYAWMQELKTVFRSRQLHLLSNKNKSMLDTIQLRRFTGDSSQTIFEFFKAFDELTKYSHTADQKAMLLCGSYLDEKIKQEVALISNDFAMLRTHLINKFGKAKHIIDVKLSVLRKTKVTDKCPPGKQADHLRLVYSVLAEIQNLGKSSQLSQESIARYAFSHDSLSLVVRSLPGTIIKDFFNEIGRLGLEAEDYEGADAFDVLVKFVQVGFKNLSAAAKLYNLEASACDDKAIHMSNLERDNDPLETTYDSSNGSGVTVHFQQSIPDRSKGVKSKAYSWYSDSFSFPCPIKGHSHELGSCEQFLGSSSKERLNMCRGKICYYCLGPWDKCNPSCVNKSRIPVKLLCQDCIVKGDNTGKHILVCKWADHSKIKVSDVAIEIANYLRGNYDTIKSILSKSAPVVAYARAPMACNAVCKDHQASLSSLPDPKVLPPIINTATGSIVKVSTDRIVRESYEDASYILQVLNIRGFDCLCFYDRGANQHLIEGDLAEKAKFKVLNARSVPIGVVGGGRIWSQYGLYSVVLGPDNNGRYHELKCQGIKKITDELPEYDLSPLNAVVRNSSMLPPCEILPDKIGGDRIKLLIGIKDATLDPVTICSIPGGLTVYRGQLRDKFGSNICYGGPHSLFTEVNKQVHGDVNLINVFFSSMVNTYLNSVYSDLVMADLDYENDMKLPIARLKEGKQDFCFKAGDEVDVAICSDPKSFDDTSVMDEQTSVPTDSEIGCDNAGIITTDPRPLAIKHHVHVDDDVDAPSNRNMITSTSGFPEADVHYCSALKSKIPLSEQSCCSYLSRAYLVSPSYISILTMCIIYLFCISACPMFRFKVEEDLAVRASKTRNYARSIDFSLEYRPDIEYQEVEKFTCFSNNVFASDDEKLLSELYGGLDPYLFHGPNKDQHALRLAYNRLSQSRIREFQTFNADDNTTMTVPLLDLLTEHVRVADGCLKFPSLDHLTDLQNTRGVSTSTLRSGHKVVEVTCGSSSEREIEDAVAFFHEKFNADQAESKTGVVAAKVEYINITKKDWVEHLPIRFSVTNNAVSVKQADVEEPSKLLPVKLVLGGLDWSLIVRLDVTTSRGSDGLLIYTITHSQIQPSLVEFLVSLPTITGYMIQNELEDWSSYMKRLGAPGFSFRNGYVFSQSIAALAGYHSKDLTMFNTVFQTLGGILPMTDSMDDGHVADGLWSLPYSELPDVFQILLIGSTRALSHVYTVFFGALVQEMFPDAEVVCQLTGQNEAQFVSWFARTVIGVVKGLKVLKPAYRSAKTRAELLSSLGLSTSAESSANIDLEIGVDSDDDLDRTVEDSSAENAVALVSLFAEAIPPTPTVVWGGSRYLHFARSFAIIQLQVFKRLDIVGVENIFKDISTDFEQLAWVCYGQTLSGGCSSAGVDSPTFVPDPNRSHPVISINPKTILNSQISEMSRCQNRPARYLLLEWARLATAEELLVLITRASEEGGSRREDRFWLPRLSRYEELRVLYTHKTGFLPPVSCAWAENRIKQYKSKAIEQTRQALAGFEGAVDSAKKRLAQLSDLESADPYRKRVRLDSAVGVIPPSVRVTTEAQRARRRRAKKARKAKKAAMVASEEQNVDEAKIAGYESPVAFERVAFDDVEQDDVNAGSEIDAVDTEQDGVCAGRDVIDNDDMEQIGTRQCSPVRPSSPALSDDMEQIGTRRCSPVRPLSPALSVTADSPRKPSCPPLPRAFWPDRRFRAPGTGVPRVLAEVDLCESEGSDDESAAADQPSAVVCRVVVVKQESMTPEPAVTFDNMNPAPMKIPDPKDMSFYTKVALECEKAGI